ncbi:hypothetical protein F8154_10120 [Alkaliphilus pronyensis]|uniref:Cobalt ECF transporter T component CbiQ n=1 Tax=Alkaliphilus pronyensis TaxID=1482732 RepID=A0A6I0F750_9FIRM|nr:energy-coupling factor transporter transmembrane component T [Alkaliphilus pronyensis]KAB3534027.1 hypothetical protein F8154_10120 [Alkaliphilus pronyensis]
MHLADIDNLSNNEDSPFHSMRAVSKLIFTAIIITLFIVSNNILELILLTTVILISFRIGKVPYGQVFHLILYPLFFSSLFALFRFQQSFTAGILVIIKACGTAMTMILLITTTPYVDIFSILSLFLPKLLVDVFLFTYRALFILIGQVESLIKSIKLRAGYSPLKIVKNLKNIANALGIVIVKSIEMNDRMYQIYALRGYNGSIPISKDVGPLKANDFLLIGFSCVILIGKVISWRL